MIPYKYAVFVFFLYSSKLFSAQTLTFNQAYDLAVIHASQLKVQKLAKTNAQLASQILEKSQWPELVFQTQGDRAWTPATDPITNEKMSAFLTYQLFDFGRSHAEREQSQGDEKTAQLLYEELELGIFWDVASAYLSVLSQVRMENLISQQVQISKQKALTLTKDYKRGLRPEHDKVAAEVELSKAQLNLTKAQNDVTMAKHRLFALIAPGMSPEERSDKTFAPNPFNSPTEILALVKKWQEAPSKKKIRLESEQEALQSQRKKISSENYPVLSAQAGYDYTSTRIGETSRWDRSGQAMIKLSWTIPWSGKNQLAQDQISTQITQISESISAEITQSQAQKQLALEALQSTEQQWGILKSQQQLYERQLNLTKQRYETGKAALLELTSAEEDLLAWRMEKIKLLNDTSNAVLDLAKSMGVTDLTGVLF